MRRRRGMMKRKNVIFTVLVMATLLLLPIAASAAEVWNFWGTQVPFQNASTSSPAVEIPGPYPIDVTNANSFTVRLTPFASTGVEGVLTGRDLGAHTDEQGAAVGGAPWGGDSTTYEINGTESLRIDLAPGFHSWELRFNSLDSNELAHVWAGCVGPGPGCVDLGTVTHQASEFDSVLVPDAYKGMPIFVTADLADVLVYGVAAEQDPAIPTMNEWGMIIFTLLAGLGAVFYLRRQKSAKS
jgi:hypothetical protein